MSKRKTDEALRKPRYFAGTPAYKISNWFTVGCIASAGLMWYLFDRWPQSQKLLQDIKDGKWDFSPEFKTRMESMKYSKEDPAYHELLIKAQKRIHEREDTPRKQSWLSKLTRSTPDI